MSGTLLTRTTAAPSRFDDLVAQAPDALLNLIALHRADDRSGKIDLGIGVFRDEAGMTPVMCAVKTAERLLLSEQDTRSISSEALSFVADQRGMFALLPISPAATASMREQHGIYMAGNGRINLAGLRFDTMSHFISGRAPHLR